MAMISRVGRKSWRTRATVAARYVALAAGAVAVLYPLALLAAGSGATLILEKYKERDVTVAIAEVQS